MRFSCQCCSSDVPQNIWCVFWNNALCAYWVWSFFNANSSIHFLHLSWVRLSKQTKQGIHSRCRSPQHPFPAPPWGSGGSPRLHRIFLHRVPGQIPSGLTQVISGVCRRHPNQVKHASTGSFWCEAATILWTRLCLEGLAHPPYGRNLFGHCVSIISFFWSPPTDHNHS